MLLFHLWKHCFPRVKCASHPKAVISASFPSRSLPLSGFGADFGLLTDTCVCCVQQSPLTQCRHVTVVCLCVWPPRSEAALHSDFPRLSVMFYQPLDVSNDFIRAGSEQALALIASRRLFVVTRLCLFSLSPFTRCALVPLRLPF